MVDGISLVKNSFQTAQAVLDQFTGNLANQERVLHFAKKIAQAFLSGNKIISCGNGGSMCDAMHFAEEFTGQFRDDRRSLPAISISDPSHITCVGNDYGFDSVFSRFVEGVGNAGDVFLGISTSGNSSNVLKALEAAKEKEMYSVALLGKTGGKALAIADHAIVVPGDTSDRIQELHIKIIHISIEVAEHLVSAGKL